MRRLLVTGVVIAGVLTVALTSALGASDAVLTPTRVGPLRIDHARAADVVRFGGKPAGNARYVIQYGCSRKTNLCKITYFLFTHGAYKGRLAGLVAGGGAIPFRTAHGVTDGMTKARARALSPHAAVTKMCGVTRLRFAPPHPGSVNPYSGLGVTLIKGKVVGLTVFSAHLRITCPKSGGFEVNN